MKIFQSETRSFGARLYPVLVRLAIVSLVVAAGVAFALSTMSARGQGVSIP
jgi:hypothetical protein